MLPVIFHPDAAAEARDSSDYYEKLQTGLGLRFETEILATAQLIQENPLLYAQDKYGERHAPLRTFSHSLIYLVSSASIFVSCVTHHKRKQRYWRKRKPDEPNT